MDVGMMSEIERLGGNRRIMQWQWCNKLFQQHKKDTTTDRPLRRQIKIAHMCHVVMGIESLIGWLFS
jgi:hypothetical protein